MRWVLIAVGVVVISFFFSLGLTVFIEFVF